MTLRVLQRFKGVLVRPLLVAAAVLLGAAAGTWVGCKLVVPALEAQEKTTSVPPVTDAVKQLRDEMLTLMANDRRFTDAAIASLKESTTVGFANLKEATAAAIASADKAVLKAEAAAADRFESVNEFRDTLSDQQKTLVSKDTFVALEKQVIENTTRLNAIQARSGGLSEGWLIAVGVVGFILTVAAFAFMLRKMNKEAP